MSIPPHSPRFALDRVGGFVFAVSLNGFFLYLGLLDALSIRPHTSLTTCWYAAVGCAAVVATIPHRRVLARRLRNVSPGLRLALACLCFLGAWFVVNVVVLGRSTLAYHFAGLFVLWTLPTAALAFSLPPRLVFAGFRYIAVLASAFLVIDLVALLRTTGSVQRFSPLAYLDPISAGNICALGAVAVLVLRPRSRLSLVAQLTLAAALLVSSAASGSRGPLAAGVVGCVAFMVVKRRWASRVLVIGMLAGAIVVGVFVAKSVGTFAYLTDSVAGVTSKGVTSKNQQPRTLPAISTVHIRQEWLADAFRHALNRPLFGHGVAQFVDETPEAHRMGIAGQRTYPHNTLAEAAFSLGLLGLVPYLLASFGTAVAMLRVRRARLPAASYVWGLAGVAAVMTSVSGEIGADAVPWAAVALAIASASDAVTRHVHGAEAESLNNGSTQISGSSASSAASSSASGRAAT